MAIQPNSYKGFRWTRGDATGGQLALLVPDIYRVLHFASAADEATDWNVANPTHPTWYVHSETTPATDYIAFSHDGTDGYMNSVGGTLRLNGVTSLYLSIGGTNEITLTATALSPTTSDGNALGTTALMWGDLFLASGGVINLNNGDITLTHSAGVLTIGGDGTVVLTLGTNVDISFTGTTGTNDIVLTNALADALSITDGAADIIVIDTSTAGNVITITGAVRGNAAITSAGATSGIGYAAGAGGTVTQQTSKATGVTLNTITGQITLNNAALAADAIVSFTLTNSAIEANDILLLNHHSVATVGAYVLTAQPGAGSAVINVANRSAGSLSEAIVIQYAVIKAVVA